MPHSLADWLAYIERQHPSAIAMGLERVREVAQRMKLPKIAQHTIIVAGTNGKGSTVAFIEAIARAAGLRVGAYTSPHLLRYNERVRIDGVEASDADLAVAFQAVESARVAQGDAIALTYFEYGTLAALWLFAAQKLDLAVLEVGLGGRLDAVNSVDADASVITTVDLDHQEWLGTDRESIGREKAGVARAFRPLILGEDDPPASVLRYAYAIGAQAIRAGCDYFFETVDDSHWRWRDVSSAISLPMPQLAAPSQLRNAACAIAALRSLPVSIGKAAHAQGVRQARLPGRLQRIQRAQIDVYLDVAHNPQAARELAQWLRLHPINGRTLVVYAALGDKASAAVVAALELDVDAWWLAGLEDAGPRGLPVEAFMQRLAGTAAERASTHAHVADALANALQVAHPGDRIVVFGSFHTVAAAMRALDAH